MPANAKEGGTRPPDAFKARPEAALRPEPSRAISIRNAHPRLRVPRAAVTRAIRLLDERFEMLPGDLAHLSLSPTRLRALKSKIEDRESKIPGGCPPGELSLVFLTDPALAKIHGDFMGDPTATDVITFEGDTTAGLAGEICVSADTAANYAGAPFSTELTLYVVHGWLHLAGYDDRQPAKKRRMRAAEKRAMALLRAAKAVPAFRLV